MKSATHSGFGRLAWNCRLTRSSSAWAKNADALPRIPFALMLESLLNHACPDFRGIPLQWANDSILSKVGVSRNPEAVQSVLASVVRTLRRVACDPRRFCARSCKDLPG